MCTLPGLLRRLLAFFVLLLIGCTSSQIIEKKEYQASIDHLKTDNVLMALKAFPKKEGNHFVTLLEKVYLQLINSDDVSSTYTTEFDQLLAQSRAIERNEKTSISNQIDQLFFIKTNEGYYPANHEIFWMHLILGMTFIKKKQIDKARVEAKRISELFARVDMSGKRFYDNPGIRLLSATMWLLCGEKDSALVDLRQLPLQWKMKPTLANESDPINWDLTFKGVGFFAETDLHSFSDKISGFKSIQFQPSVKDSELAMIQPMTDNMTFSSKSWHSENLIRNEEFKDTIQKSKYMSRMFKSELEYQSLNLLTSVATGVVLATGITIGVGIVGGGIYLLASQANAGDAAGQVIAIGFLVGGEIYEGGMRFYKTTQNQIQSERKDFQDVSRFYRYVRFIPDYFVLNKNNEFIDKKAIPFLKSENSSGKIRIFFQP